MASIENNFLNGAYPAISVLQAAVNHLIKNGDKMPLKRVN